MEFEFDGEIVEWRGPAPFYFVFLPEAEAAELRLASPAVSYGWGVIPVTARIGRTRWTTSLFPKDDSYAVPLKVAVRRAEDLHEGDSVTVRLSIAV